MPRAKFRAQCQHFREHGVIQGLSAGTHSDMQQRGAGPGPPLVDGEIKSAQVFFASTCILGIAAIVRTAAGMKDSPMWDCYRMPLKIEETASHGLQ